MMGRGASIGVEVEKVRGAGARGVTTTARPEAPIDGFGNCADAGKLAATLGRTVAAGDTGVGTEASLLPGASDLGGCGVTGATMCAGGLLAMIGASAVGVCNEFISKPTSKAAAAAIPASLGAQRRQKPGCVVGVSAAVAFRRRSSSPTGAASGAIALSASVVAAISLAARAHTGQASR
jgi:hypothetical protein